MNNLKLFFWGLPFVVFGIYLGCKNVYVYPFFVLFGVIIWAPPLADILSRPFSKLIFPQKYSDSVPPFFGKAVGSAGRGRYEEALLHYEEILIDHPEEVKCYVDMIKICIKHLGDPDRAEKIVLRGLFVLTNDDDKVYLSEMFQNFSQMKENMPNLGI